MEFFGQSPALSGEAAFSREILRSEIKRVRIIAYLLAGLFVVVFGLSLFARSLVGPENFQYWQLRYALLTLAVALAYEVLAYYGFRYFLKRNRPVPMVSRFANAFIETSIPTFMILAFTDLVHPLEAIYSPPSYAYFFFIMLSTMRLQYRLSVFTGFVAGIEYALLVLYYQPELVSSGLVLNPAMGGGTALAFTPFHVAKVLMYIASGFVAAYVAVELRNGFLNSLSSVEERNRVVEMFGAHVSPEVVEKLLDQQTEMESETRHVCVMFLDIRNFTGFSENRSPDEVVEYLNTLFDFMIDCINDNNGIINKFLGDGFMAVFGAPISDGRDSRNAIQAASQILDALEKWNESGKIHPTAVGIGLHAGAAVTGNVGSYRRKEYTIIGDTVNVASRLEQMNKKFGSSLLISETVRNDAAEAGLEVEGEMLEPIQVRGRQEPVPVFRLR